jgi:hypothetical protein
MLRRGIAAVAAGLLLLTTSAGPSHAGTRSQLDNDDYDVLHRDIDIKKLKVTYDGKGVRATITMKDLRKKKRIRIFVGMVTRVDDSDPNSPEFGNFVELRLTERGRKRAVNWVTLPTSNGYFVEKCAGVKVRANFKTDKITYKMPNRCARWDLGRGYVDTWASARKYNPGTWDEGSPAFSTGDWFDTTYDLVVTR